MGTMMIEKSENGIFVTGIIDEHSNFKDIFAGIKEFCTIDMAGIQRINSCGVREWTKAVSNSNLKLEYINCPTVVVEQFNMVPEFLGKIAEVKSFYARYYCEDCDIEKDFLLDVKNCFPDKNNITPPEVICECGSPFEFDDDESEFFLFLEDSK